MVGYKKILIDWLLHALKPSLAQIEPMELHSWEKIIKPTLLLVYYMFTTSQNMYAKHRARRMRACLLENSYWLQLELVQIRESRVCHTSVL